MLLGLARVVTLRSESRRTQDHILLPKLAGPGPRIYIPQEQGSPVIPPGTGFHLRCLLRLAGLRWKYSNPPPHGSVCLVLRTTEGIRYHVQENRIFISIKLIYNIIYNYILYIIIIYNYILYYIEVK
jgi:hypothetical protein